ncbi:MAG: MBL fold metallo-hydrolase, partial [Candidatus Methanomethylophilaceae archaeon]|nr:MBL fold metallo-hydrolase [Candidatus Methanomethylophilaceae archaeon]
ADQYIGSRVLILPVTTPRGNRIRYHMCTDDAVPFIQRVKPELAIFVHLGVVILRRGVDEEASYVQQETGVRTMAAHDLMVMDVGEEISLTDATIYDDDWIPSTAP